VLGAALDLDRDGRLSLTTLPTSVRVFLAFGSV
jgi:hypothetical protein